MPRAILLTILLATVCWAQDPTASQRADELFKEAEQLARQNQAEASLAKSDEGVVQLDAAVAAGQKLNRPSFDGLRRASQIARDALLDYERALGYANKLLALADSDYWRTPARLEIAGIYRAQGDFAKAAEVYDSIVAGDARYVPQALIPQAEMVYFDQGDVERGQPMLEAALMTQAINIRERQNALLRYAARAVDQGDVDDALAWYAMAEKLPADKPEDRDRALSRVWLEMGRIEESRGRTDAAKELYRKAMELSDGEMRFRVQARDALEGIDYFE